MGYSFPNSPSIGDEANGYVWDGAAWITPTGTSDFLTLTTPVAATGSVMEQPISDWFAGAPIIEILEDVGVGDEHRGCWLHMMSDIGSLIVLPDDWQPGQCFGARQIGIGPVLFQVTGGATMQMPSTRIDHSTIAEQYEEVIFKCVGQDEGGHAAVWTALGGTL